MHCVLCEDTGWVDPRDLPDASAELSWCDHCLGVGLAGCPSCDGDGVTAALVPCISDAHRSSASHLPAA